jgi:hypothetical protein
MLRGGRAPLLGHVYALDASNTIMHAVSLCVWRLTE